MVKSYLRYEPSLTFGVIASSDSNITYTQTPQSTPHLLTPALDSISLYDLRKGSCAAALTPSPSSPRLAVSSIAANPTANNTFASGHADGSVRLWAIDGARCDATLNGHKSAVTGLRYSHDGARLASGAKDCDVILWDVVGEAGLFRLRGHRDQVTDLVFLDLGKKLVTASKDKFMRVWDLELQQCVQIVSGHRSEIWSLDVDVDERYLVAGSADMELRFYKISKEGVENEGESKWEVLTMFGEIQRQCKDRAGTVRFNKSGNLLACQAAGKTVEVYNVLDDTDAKRKAKRRVHRKKEKASGKASTEGNENGGATGIEPPVVLVSDVFKLLQVLRASKKISSIAFSPVVPKGGLATLSLSLNSNMLESYLVEADKVTKKHAIEMQGHRSDIRSVSLSSDNTLLLSTSHNAAKIWNPSTGNCIRTIETGYGLCSSFVPGDRYALVGTKTGTLEIIDVGSGTRSEVVEAHGDSLRSIACIPDKSGFVTGGADHDLKVWEYRTIQKPGQDSKQLTVANVRTQKMSDDVLVVCISPNAKLIAVALLDYTVQVLFLDSLKEKFKLYGHKLPVLCMDISSDGDLIVTGSADKNIKIWGLDFADCHKSIFAHADSVTDVKFVPKTHYIFSVGKDRILKYWDADKFQLLLTLEGHHAEVWSLAVSSRGDFLVTGSHDRSIRRWDRTEEPFFIEEEREKRLEEMFESDFVSSNENSYVPKEEVPEEGSVGVPGKKTQVTLTATDLIIDALDTADAELKRIEQHKVDPKISGGEFQANIMMHGLSPSEFVLRALSTVHTNDLEQTLLSLPFSDALKLLSFLKEWTRIPDKVELVCRVTTILLQTHHNQLVATLGARPILTVLKDILHQRVKECKDTIGFNLAAMDHLKELLSMKSDAPFRDAKAKLMEIRAQQSKRHDRPGTEDRRKKKKQKNTTDTRVGA